MIEVVGLTKLYGDIVAVKDLSFQVQPGQVLGLVGPNGAGKTSTLRCIAGIVPPASGSIHICGHDLRTTPLPAKQALSYFADEPRLFEYLTVRQHLAFISRLYGVPDTETRARQLLDDLELTDKRDVLPGELSRGMKQKLALACGLIHDPQVLFFDEPLTGLDPYGIRRMKDTILQRAHAGLAVVVSSHLLHLVDEICTHLLILKRGQSVAWGPLDEVRRRFAESTSDASLEEVFFRATGDGNAP